MSERETINQGGREMKRAICWNMSVDHETGEYVAVAEVEGIVKRGQYSDEVEKEIREALKEYYRKEE